MIDLQQFCGIETEIREWMLKPWSHGGRTYGTNGHILVRCNGDAEPKAHRRPAKVPKKIDANIDAASGGTVAAIPALPPIVVCLNCKGSGFDEESDDWTCPHCIHGYIPAPVWIGGSRFLLEYITKISQLPGVVFRTNGKNVAAHFTFDGGDGIVMPIKETEADIEYESWVAQLTGADRD